jgi:hypothetical protein
MCSRDGVVRPAIASAKIDMAATYDNRFVEAALKTLK